jgi:hypothetical protein
VGLVRLRGAFKGKGTGHERSDGHDNVCDLSVNLANECDDNCFIENRGAVRCARFWPVSSPAISPRRV